MSESAVPPIEVPEERALTRDRILDAAETLFAEKGFEAASVRDITAAAGVNIAAVNYHFGGKDSLYREMALRILRQMRDEHVEAVRRAMGVPRDRRTLERLLTEAAHAFMAPFGASRRSSVVLQLWARERVNCRTSPRACYDELIEPVDRTLTAAIREVVPGLDEAAARLTIMSFLSQLFHVVEMASFMGTSEEQSLFGISLRDVVDHIVRFTAAGSRGLTGGSVP